MDFTIRFNEEKNQLLKATRGISFDDIVEMLQQEKLLDDIAHPSNKHAKQRMFIFDFNNYVYAVPYVIDGGKREIFLKTIYASRVLTKNIIRGDSYEKTTTESLRTSGA